MALLTSYRYRGVELNDGVNYAVPNNGLTLDDRQVAEESWVYRRTSTPISSGITLKEGVIPMNIHIIAASGADFQTKLENLLRIFDTTDPRFLRLERKLPHEQYYRYIEAAPRQVTVSRTERKVTVTLNTPERAWKEDAWQTQVFTVLDGVPRTHTLTINYQGLTPVEPQVIVKAKQAGSGDTYLPLYLREVEVYVASAQAAVRNPICIMRNWNTTTLVSAGKMRADGLDITVLDSAGRRLRRVVTGTQAARNVWVSADSWPSQPEVQLHITIGNYTDTSTELPVFVSGTGVKFDAVPASGTIAIGDEILSYTGKRKASETTGFLTGCTRGLNGTTAIDFATPGVGEASWKFALIKYRTVLTIGYGYAESLQLTSIFPNTFNAAWPLIDYVASDNKTWYQNTEFVDVNGASPRPLSWVPMRWQSERAGEDVRIERQSEDPGPLTFDGYRNANSKVSYRERAVMTFPKGRYVSKARLKYQLRGSVLGDQALAWVGLTERGFQDRFYVDPKGNVYTNEVYRFLHSGTAPTNSYVNIDTNYLFTSQEVGFTHLFIWLSQAPFSSPGNNLVMTQVELQMDRTYRSWPVTYLRAGERGFGNGEFPVVLTWVNNSDPEAETFEIWPRMALNNTVTYDCAAYTVSGEPIGTCSFENLNWLRLVPGTNSIVVTGAAGVGETEITIRWRNKK
jgi:hypothetical protein